MAVFLANQKDEFYVKYEYDELRLFVHGTCDSNARTYNLPT